VAAKTLSTRLAYGSFGASLFTFLGPGFHFSTNPGVSKSELAGEATGLGIVIGLVGIALAILANKRLSTDQDKTGLGWARAAIGISGVGVVVWLIVLIARGLC